MSALESIQISTGALRETLKGQGGGAAGDGKAFLQALLDSEFAADGEITGEELVQFLESRGGKDLPVLGELLPQMLALEGADEDPSVSEESNAGPQAVVAGLLAMIEGPAQAQARAGGSPAMDGLIQHGGGDGRALSAAQLREVLMQGMAAARAAEGDAGGPGRLEDFQLALNRLAGPINPGAGQPTAEASPQRPLPTLQIQTPPGQPGWGQAVGDKLAWMVRSEVQQARIQLNPPGMGPLDIAVNIQEDKASVTFTAQHAVTREALQAELPRLRAMMNDNGFETVDLDVAQDPGTGDSHFAGAGGDGEPGAGGGGAGEGDGAEGAAPVLQPVSTQGEGLIDHYA